MNRFIAPILLALILSACGLQPLYSGGSKGAVATTLGSVSVATIEGKSGWLMRNALTDRLGAQDSNVAQFRLVVTLDDRIEGFGVRADDTVTRERRTLRARYQLISIANERMAYFSNMSDFTPYNAVVNDQVFIQGHGRLRKGVVVETTGSRFIVAYVTPSNHNDLKYKTLPLSRLYRKVDA